MKLSELLKDKTFPVKVTHPGWGPGDWVEIIADTRGDGYPGFSETGRATILHAFDNETEWKLYVEPKKKKKLYAWIIDNGVMVLRFVENPNMQQCDSLVPIYRAPQFDCEVECE